MGCKNPFLIMELSWIVCRINVFMFRLATTNLLIEYAYTVCLCFCVYGWTQYGLHLEEQITFSTFRNLILWKY